jgi:hypothetical protein
VRPKVYQRLQELEKISAAAVDQTTRMSWVDRQALAELAARMEAWAVDPRLEQLLAEEPPEFLWIRVRELRQQLMGRANGRRLAARERAG